MLGSDDGDSDDDLPILVSSSGAIKVVSSGVLPARGDDRLSKFAPGGRAPGRGFSSAGANRLSARHLCSFSSRR